MSARPRKGWCPGALRPMPANDGLIVRLRITGGIVAAATARVLADLAERHGNGRFDLSARANLQMRGVREAELPMLHATLRGLGLVDTDESAEAVRNVIASPLAGLGHGLDIRPLVAALETRLSDDVALRALPPKFGFLVDDGGMPSLADIAADVRFDWVAADAAFAVGLGDARDDCLRIGSCPPGELVERAAAIARGALALGLGAGRRMRGLVADLGAAAVARACGGIPGETPAATFQRDTPVAVGQFSVRGLPVLGLATPFGRLDAGMLRLAADVAAGTELGELRLTPWRSLLVPGPPSATIDPGRLRAGGFIVDRDDPRLAVAACVGAPECASATTPTRADAVMLADLAAALGTHGGSLHVSGCEKGCAKPSASTVTLVGREGRYDLVRDGAAGDTPARTRLDLERVRAAIAELLA